MKTILIGGYYGAGNIGDEAILECMLKDLRALRSDLNFFVTSWNPSQTSKQYNVKGIHWKDILGLLEACQNSNLIILGGGGLFQDYWGIDPTTYLRTSSGDITSYGSLPLLANLLGIPCMIYAVGLGPFKCAEALQHTRYAIENCQSITLRDPDSLELLRKSGYFDDKSNPIPRVLADPVFTLVTSAEDDIFAEKLLQSIGIDFQKKRIAVILRHWETNESGLSWLENVSSGLNKFLMDNNSFQVVLISFQNNVLSEITNDSAINELIQKYDGQNKYHMLCESYSARIAQALIKKCDLVLGMRLHSLIMGINAGTPIVGIPYDPKVTSLMTLAGLSRYCCQDFPPHAEDVATKLDLAWKDRKKNLLATREFQSTSFVAAKENPKIALELLANDLSLPRKFSQQFLIDQIKLIVDLDHSIEIISRENFELQEKIDLTRVELENTKNDNDINQINLSNISEKLDLLIKERDTIIAENKKRELDLKKKLFIRINEIREKEFELTTVRSNLNLIYSSKFWKLASFYYSWINKLKSKKSPTATSKFNSPNVNNFLNEVVSLINSRSLKGVFVVTSTLPFDEFYNQRVINLTKFLSNYGYGVIYVAWRWIPSSDLIGDTLEVFKNVFQLPIDLVVNNSFSFKDISHQKKYLIVEFPHPDLFYIALQLRKYEFVLVYEIIDDWESFHEEGQAIWYDGAIERSLVLNANILTAVSSPLLRKFSNIRHDIILLPNGYDPNLLGKRNKNISKGMYSNEEVNIGYFGHLTEAWFDWGFLLNLLELVEEKRINVIFHIIGYGEPDLKFLKKFGKKIIFYGRVNPTELHHHVKNWDIAMIPFKEGKLAESVDPIKLYEYLYFGLPVIVRGITHLKNHPFVQLVSTELQFLEAIRNFGNLLKTRDKNKELARIITESTWMKRFAILLEDLESGPWMFL